MYLNEGKLKTIKVKDYDENGIYFDKDENGWLDQDIESDKLLNKGDTLIINAAHSASHVGSKIGYCSVIPPIKSILSGEIMILRPKDGQILPLLLNYLAKSDPFRVQIRELINGIHLYPKDVK